MRDWRGRLGRVLTAWAQVWTTWPGFARGCMVVVGGYSLGYATWAALHPLSVDRMIADRFERPASLSVLAWYVGAGVLVALAWWVILSYRSVAREDRSPDELARQARWPSALALLLPLLAVGWQVRTYGWSSLSTIARVGIPLAALGVLWSFGVQVPEAWMSWIRQRLSLRWAIVVTLVCAAGLGWAGILRHRSFNSTALDMAMMDQLVWNTAQGRVLQGTLASPGPESFLAHHFSPILAILAPLYWFAPFPETLVVVQAAAIALSALCFYAMGVHVTGQRWLALCLCVSFLLNPALHTAALFDFHQDVLGMLFMAFGLMCVAYERWVWAVAGWLLGLLCKEELAIYWAAIAFFLFVMARKRRWVYAAGAVLNVVWLLTVVYVVIPAFASEPGGSFLFLGRYREFGSTPIELLRSLAINPVYVLRNLLSEARIVGIVVLVSPVIFLVWRGRPETWILLAPLAINLGSALGAQQSFSAHYSMLPLAAVYAAAIQGAKRQRTGSRSSAADVLRWNDRQGAYALVASFTLFLLLSPLGLRVVDTLRKYERDAHDVLGTQIVHEIPSEAAVVAQDRLVPHLSQRQTVQRFPSVWLNSPRYYVFDVTEDPYPMSPQVYHQAVSDLIQSPEYGPVRVQDGYIVLERDAGRERVAEALAMLDSMAPLSPDQ